MTALSEIKLLVRGLPSDYNNPANHRLPPLSNLDRALFATTKALFKMIGRETILSLKPHQLFGDIKAASAFLDESGEYSLYNALFLTPRGTKATLVAVHILRSGTQATQEDLNQAVQIQNIELVAEMLHASQNVKPRIELVNATVRELKESEKSFQRDGAMLERARTIAGMLEQADPDDTLPPTPPPSYDTDGYVY